MEKRGLSQIIVVILIILLALTAVSIISFYLTPIFLSPERNVNFDALSVDFEIIPTTTLNTQQPQATIIVKRRPGGGTIDEYSLVLEDSSGNTCVNQQKIPINELESHSITVSFASACPQNPNFNKDTIKSIYVIPQFRNNAGELVAGTQSGVYEVPQFLSGSGAIPQSGPTCNAKDGCKSGCTPCDPDCTSCITPAPTPTPTCTTNTVCNDNKACTIDSCNTATGACQYTTITCNDNDACTTDSCNTATGACQSTTITCPSDNNECTTDSCDPTTGSCTSTPVADNTLCAGGTSTCSGGSCLPSPLTSSLVAWYKLDNNPTAPIPESPTFIYDWSGKGNTGTPAGNAVPVTNGKYGGAYSFDGSGDYISLGTVVAGDKKDISSKSFTIAAWLNTPSQQAYRGIVTYATSTNRITGIATGTSSNAGKPLAGLYTALQNWASCGQFPPVNAWYLVVERYDAATQTLSVYLNGVQCGSSINVPNTHNVAGYWLSIGIIRRTSPAESWNGLIDEVMIFKKALTPQEITTIFNKQLS